MKRKGRERILAKGRGNTLPLGGGVLLGEGNLFFSRKPSWKSRPLTGLELLQEGKKTGNVGQAIRHVGGGDDGGCEDKE